MKQGDKECCICTKRKYGKLICAGAGAALLMLALVTFIFNPVHLISKYMIRVSKGSYLYQILNEEIPCVYLHAYLFNVTNGDAFLSGEDTKLKVEEVGPFTYQEFRRNEDFEVDEKRGVMRYSPKFRTRFIPELSLADPKDVILQMPNIALLSLATRLSPYPYFTRLGFDVLVRQLNSKPIVTIDVHSFLWGLDEPIIRLGNALFPGVVNFTKLGILDRLYDIERFRIEMGISEKDKFMIKKVNGVEGLPMLGYGTEQQSRCNTFENVYEGIGYPPDLTKDTPLRIYRYCFCRILDLQYKATRTLENGAEAFVYTLGNRTYSINNDTKCLCNRPKCIDGLSNLAPCFYDVSSGLSHAHFLHSDPKVYERVEGIAPNEEQHGSEFVIDPKLGVALSTHFTIQGSMVMTDVSYNKVVKPFANMVVPVLYFKIVQPELTANVKRILWIEYVLGPYIQAISASIYLILGLTLLALVYRSCYPLHTKQKDLNYKICTQIKPLIHDNCESISKQYGDNRS